MTVVVQPYPQQPATTVVVTTTNAQPVLDNDWVCPEGGCTAFLAYFFGWISGLIVLCMETRWRYNVFHAHQSISWSFFWTIWYIIFYIIDVYAIGQLVLTYIWYFVWLIVWSWLLYNAVVGARTGRIYQLPGYIGRRAEFRARMWQPRQR